jgi:hypothetical protein
MVGTMKKAADPKAGGVNSVLRDDESAGIHDVGIDREGFVGDEMWIYGNGELEFTMDVVEVAKSKDAATEARAVPPEIPGGESESRF